MQKNSLNIIVFDEDEPSFPDQSFLARKSSLNNSMGFDIVTQEMESLHQKLKDLQRKTQKINRQFSTKRVQANRSQQSYPPSHYENILITIETKIQFILKETQTLMKKITSNFQRKLKQKASQYKNVNLDGHIQKMQNQMRRVEAQYANEIKKIQSKNQQLQQQTYNRLNDIQQQYAQRVIEFQRKQRDYADKIQQLQNKIRNLMKNKKALEVTQGKMPSKQQINYENTMKNHNPVLPNNIINNIEYNTGEQDRKSTFIANDTSNSRIRRRKIFEKNQNRSISPNQRPTNKVISPLRYDNNFINRNTVSQNNIIESKTIIPENIKSSQKMKQKISHSNQKKTAFQATPTASDFYRDIPKANWQKFQCFDKQDESSQQDVFFYPQHGNFKKQTNQASELDNFLSPLDLN